MKRHTLKALDDILGPERVASAKANARRKMEAMLLGEVRNQLGFTQTAIAKAMGDAPVPPCRKWNRKMTCN